MSDGEKPGVTMSATSARSLAELRAICKAHGIKNTVEYEERYKYIPDLPAHPERIFKNEWISYSEFFDIPPSLQALSRQDSGVHEASLWRRNQGEQSLSFRQKIC